MEVGYKLASEEHGPNELVRFAGLAEEHGFSFALTTKRLHLGTAVTCPTVRVHPAIVAQAAATATSMMPGRFFLGVGTILPRLKIGRKKAA